MTQLSRTYDGQNWRAKILRLAFAVASISGLTVPAGAFDIKLCEKDNLAPQVLRTCLGLAADPDLTAGERANIYVMRGVSWLKENEPVAAAADFSRAVVVDPTNIAALKGRATAHSQKGAHELAANDWSLILKIKPGNEESYRQRGASWSAAGKTDAAIGDFAKALELNPKSVEAHIGRAGVFDKLNQRDKAIQEFELAVNIDPNYFPVYQARAEAAVRWGETKLAIDSYRNLLRINADDWHARKALQRLGVEQTTGRQ